MKSIWGWNDIVIHPFTILYLILAWFCGLLFEYSMTLLIVIIHELFHYAFASLFLFKITNVKIMPFGAFLELEDYGLHHIVEEMVVILAGLCSHFFIYIIILLFGANQTLLDINVMIFCFNLLPIYPLDGSKLLLLILSIFIQYKSAILLQIKISLLCLSTLCILRFETSYIIILGYLLYINFKYCKEYRYQIIRLLLSRQSNSMYKRIKLLHTLKFYRPYTNIYIEDNICYDEYEVIEELIKSVKK